MAGPWEKYRAEPAAAKPWERYRAQQAAEPVADDRSTLDKLVDFTADAVRGPAQKVGEALSVVAQPVAELDKVSGAPLRAAERAFQDKAPLEDVVGAGVDQFKAGLPSIGPDGSLKAGEILPTTPTDEEIARRGIIASGIRPEFADVMAPLQGAANGAVMDLTQLIPGSGATKAVSKTADLVTAAGKPLAKAAAKVEMGAAKAIARTGQVMTQGVLKADRALQMYRELSAGEMLLPGTKDFGATAKQVKRVGEFRQALREVPITVPGSHDVAQQVRKMVEEAEYRSGRTPGSERLLKMIEERAFEKEIVQDPPVIEAVDDGFGNMAETVTQPTQFREVVKPRDLTLDELDDLIREADDIGYTPIGNPRSQPAKWAPTVTAVRRHLDEALQSVPAGQMFKEEKQRAAALATAGTKRSKLLEVASNVATAGAGVITLQPAALLLQSFKPSTYVNMLAALKVPREVAQALKASYDTGRIGVMRDAIAGLAKRSPAIAERLVRGAALVAGKPDGSLTKDEVASLDAVRVFDPEQVAAERARIQGDTSMNSVAKAKALSDLNKNGYVTLPPVKAPEQAADDQVFGGEEGKQRLLDALKRSQGH